MNDDQIKSLLTSYSLLQDRISDVNQRIKDAGRYGEYASMPSLLQQQSSLMGSKHGFQLALMSLGKILIEDRRTGAIDIRDMPDRKLRCGECGNYKPLAQWCSYRMNSVSDTDLRCYQYRPRTEEDNEDDF